MNYAPILNYAPLKIKFENLVCKISHKVFELEPSKFGMQISRSPD